MTKGKELFIRTRTAIIFATVMLSCIYFNVYSYLALMAFVMLASINEFQNVLKPVRSASKASTIYKGLSYLIAVIIFTGAYVLATGQVSAKWLLILPALLFLFLVIELYGASKEPFTNMAFNILGLIYLCTPFAVLHFVAIRNGVYEYKIVIAMLFLIWANDSFAYLTGSRIGKHKMIPRISPGKTWEGFAGGIVGSIIFAVIMNYTFKLDFLQLTDWVCLGIIVSIAATLGDLIESMLKRSLNIKDTGTLLPGHGGVLDRFDAFYFAVLLVALYLVLADKI